jgi:hypothetical protein
MPPPPPIQLLLSLLTWQLPAAQKLSRHFPNPLPPPNNLLLTMVITLKQLCTLYVIMKPKHLFPLSTYCPITGPSPHMRKLLDGGTWHQQQLKQLAAFSHPNTQGFISQLELTVYSTGILERIKNFTIPNNFI